MSAPVEGQVGEIPDILGILAHKFPQVHLFGFIYQWENITYSLLVISVISIFAYLVSRKLSMLPGRRQSAAEAIIQGLDDFVCGVIGPQGRKYTPFIGTLFIYIICMNLSGLIPFIKASTASWSTTLALALCVFFYVQYTGIRELGFWGYLDHLAGKPRGVIAATVIFPIFMLILHVITELIRPLSLSLRLRGNIWGDETLIAVLAGFGLAGIPMLFFNMLMVVLTAVIQAIVFSLLTTVYFALVLAHDEETA